MHSWRHCWAATSRGALLDIIKWDCRAKMFPNGLWGTWVPTTVPIEKSWAMHRCIPLLCNLAPVLRFPH